MKIVLFSLVPETKYGGSAVYTAHLYRALVELGHDPILVRVGAKTSTSSRMFTHEVPYYNVSSADALSLAKSHKSLITYVHWKTHAEIAKELLERGAPIVIHDPATFYPELFDVIKARGNNVVAIRRGNAQVMIDAGLRNVRFIAHPYIRTGSATRPAKVAHARCLGRVDFRKHQEIICAANDLLAPHQQIEIHGDLNRMFAHHLLDTKFSDWRRNLNKPFATTWGSGTAMLEACDFAVDLTEIKKSNDGDGSQYLFMEAWDARTSLICNRGWIRTGTDEVRHDETAWAVSTPEELVTALTEPRPMKHLIENGLAQLELHTSEVVVPQYMEIL